MTMQTIVPKKIWGQLEQTAIRCISDADMHSNRQNGEEQVKFPYVLA